MVAQFAPERSACSHGCRKGGPQAGREGHAGEGDKLLGQPEEGVPGEGTRKCKQGEVGQTEAARGAQAGQHRTFGAQQAHEVKGLEANQPKDREFAASALQRHPEGGGDADDPTGDHEAAEPTTHLREGGEQIL